MPKPPTRQTRQQELGLGMCQQRVAIRDGYRADGRRLVPHYVQRLCRRKAAVLKDHGQFPVCQQHARCAW